MYKVHKIIFAVLFVIIFVLSYLLNISITEIRSDMLTVISIIQGFVITVLSIMIGQDFIKNLNTKIDNRTTLKQTKLQTLSYYFRNAFIFGIVNIALLVLLGIKSDNIYNLLSKIMDSDKILIVQYLFYRIINSLAISFFVINLVLVFFLWRVLMNLFIKSGK